MSTAGCASAAEIGAARPGLVKHNINLKCAGNERHDHACTQWM